MPRTLSHVGRGARQPSAAVAAGFFVRANRNTIVIELIEEPLGQAHDLRARVFASRHTQRGAREQASAASSRWPQRQGFMAAPSWTRGG